MSRKRIIFTALFLMICHTVTGQVSTVRDIALEKSEQTTVLQGIPGSFFLQEEHARIREFLQNNPEIAKLSKPSRSHAWDFSIGDQRNWWATDFETEEEYAVPSTCRAVGENCYVFVEDALWEEVGNGRVTQAGVDSILAAFDHRTPADSEKGIYEMITEHFGNPPDVDNDPRIIILILDIKDGIDPDEGHYVAGYYHALHQYADGTFSGRRSNHAEMMFIDGDPAELTKPAGLAAATSTTAHEFQHMIHWGKDSNEWTFVNEGCSEMAEVICGFSLRRQARFNENSNRYLFEWETIGSSDVLIDYARAARWTLYLYEQFPNHYLKNMVANKGIGIAGINQSLAEYSPYTSRRFIDIFEDWCIANYLNDASVNTRYGYDYTPLPSVKAENVYINPNVSTVSTVVQRMSAKYITFNGGSDLEIIFNSTASNLAVKAIKKGNTNSVSHVPLNTTYSAPEFGTEYNEITFVIINKNENNAATVTYTAQGETPRTGLEIFYDDGEPEGFLNLSQGDTIAVYFSGREGTSLDSFRVAFRQQGTIKMGINRYTGEIRPTPLGEVIVAPKTITSNATSPFPYPVPYENWITVDLTEYHINSNIDFVIWFEVEDSSVPGVMISSETDEGEYYSYTYLTDNANWYYLTDGQGNVFKYLVRAYLGVPTSVDGREVIPAQPLVFSLSQNYPNPFNPETTIQYSLTDANRVQLHIFDMRGRLVRTVVNEMQSAGNHMVTIGAGDLPSGTYIYQLQAGDNVLSRRMVLVK